MVFTNFKQQKSESFLAISSKKFKDDKVFCLYCHSLVHCFIFNYAMKEQTIKWGEEPITVLIDGACNKQTW